MSLKNGAYAVSPAKKRCGGGGAVHTNPLHRARFRCRTACARKNASAGVSVMGGCVGDVACCPPVAFLEHGECLLIGEPPCFRVVLRRAEVEAPRWGRRQITVVVVVVAEGNRGNRRQVVEMHS